MNNNLIRLFFAWDIPFILCCQITPVVGSFWISWLSVRPIGNLKEPIFIGLALMIVLLAAPLIYFSALVFLGFFVSPFYLAMEKMNGGPFKEGDTVYILTGRNKGKTTEVYSEWQGNTVRLRLSEEEKEGYKDIYSPTKILKTSKLIQLAQVTPCNPSENHLNH